MSFTDRSFLVANAQPGSCHIIYCSDGFCKMSGFSRAEVIGRPSVCEFLHGPLTSQLAVQSVKQAFNTYVEKHQQILYYRKDGKSVASSLLFSFSDISFSFNTFHLMICFLTYFHSFFHISCTFTVLWFLNFLRLSHFISFSNYLKSQTARNGVVVTFQISALKIKMKVKLCAVDHEIFFVK